MEEAREFYKEKLPKILDWIPEGVLWYNSATAKYYIHTPKGRINITCGDVIFKDELGEYYVYCLKEE